MCSEFVMKQRGTLIPPSGRARVLVVMGPIQEGEGTSTDVFNIPRIGFLIHHLGLLGWSEQEIRETFAFTWETRCPLPTGQKWTAKRRKACAAFAKRDAISLGAEVVVFLGYKHWMPFFKNRQKNEVTGRAIPVTWNTKDLFAVEKGHDHQVHILTVDAPEDVRRQPDVQDIETWYNDLSKIRATLDGHFPFDPFADKTYELVRTPERAVEILDWYAQQPICAWDIESGNAPHALDPYSRKFKILGISLCSMRKTAHFIPLWHKDCTLAQHPEVIEALRRCLLAQTFQVAHNGVAFDAVALALKTGIWPRISWDTMLADGEINENREHKLKGLVALFVPDLGHYEDDMKSHMPKVKKEDRDYELHLPLEVCARYACADADGTLGLYFAQRQIMERIGNPVWGTMLDLFLQHRMRDAHAAAQMSVNGAVVHPERCEALRTKLAAQMKEINDKLFARPEVAEYQRVVSAQFTAQGKLYFDGRYIFESQVGAQMGFQPMYDVQTDVELVAGAKDRLIKARIVKKNGEPYANKVFGPQAIQFNPGSPDHLGVLCQKVLKISSTKKTAANNDSWDEEVLKALAEVNDFLALILDWRHISKAESTYARPVVNGFYEYTTPKGETKRKRGWIRDDGLVHADFLLSGADRGFDTKQEEKGGTRTKRKSSRDPNLQNVEKHSDYGKELYGFFISRFGDPRFPFAITEQHARYIWSQMTAAERAVVEGWAYPGHPGGGCILQVDYSQLELRVFAIVIGCLWMIEQYQRGADLHGELAMEVFQASRDEILADNKLLRSAAKKLWFGPIYGQGAKGLWIEMVKLGVKSPNDPSRSISLEEVKEILARLDAKMPEFAAFKDKVRETIHGPSRALYALSGARRFLPQVDSQDSYISSKALRQAVNFTIQNLGGECTNWANYILMDRLQAEGFRTKIINNVHDSIVFDCPSDEVVRVYQMARQVMEHPPFPGLGDSSPIPLVTDGEVGSDWGALIEIEDCLGEVFQFDQSYLNKLFKEVA